MRTNTFQVTSVFRRTFYITIGLVFLLMAGAEWVTRLDAFQAPLTPPRMGSRHYQLGHKLAFLDAEVKKTGRIDCIMIGNSTVDWGFNPATFENAYRKVSGKEIHCFNFGINGSYAVTTAMIAKILVEDYHPSILIIGTDARDFAVPVTDAQPAVILQTPWIQYRLGHVSLDGWLTEQSFFYRYRQHLSRLMHLNFRNTLWSETELDDKILANGYTPIDKVADYITKPPDLRGEAFDYFSRIFVPYRILDENVDALESMLRYDAKATRVIVVEMPVSDGFYQFFGNDKEDYELFAGTVNELTAMHNVPFLRTESLDLIPDDGWSDYSHLNVTGAEIFSGWLGKQVGKLDVRQDAAGFAP